MIKLCTEIVSWRDQRLEVIQSSEGRIHVLEVGDVVAEVLHRAFVDRREPDGLDTQLGEIVQPGFDSLRLSNNNLSTETFLRLVSF